jgi:hypothetical protein
MPLDYLGLFRYLADPAIPFQPRFKVPHTLLYDMGSLDQWVFTDRAGVIRRKHRKSITRERVQAAFLRGH